MAKEHYTIVTRKGQITVPAEVRRALGLHIGDRVAVSVNEADGPSATVRPVASVTDATFGVFHSPDLAADDEHVRQAFTEHAAERDARTRNA